MVGTFLSKSTRPEVRALNKSKRPADDTAETPDEGSIFYVPGRRLYFVNRLRIDLECFHEV